MTLTTKAIAIALTLAVLPTIGVRPAPAWAGDHVTVDFGAIAFGYRDGYWDHDRHWHRWADDREAARYREEQRERYYDWNHDRDRDEGWHDRDWHDDRDRDHERHERHEHEDHDRDRHDEDR